MLRRNNKKGAAGYHGGTRVFTRYLIAFLSLQIVLITVMGVVLSYFVADLWMNDRQQSLLSYSGYVADALSSLETDNAKGESDESTDLIYSITNYSELPESDVFVTDAAGNVVYCKEMALEKKEYTGACDCELHKALRLPGEYVVAIRTDGQLSLMTEIPALGEGDMFIGASAALNGETHEIVGYVCVTSPVSEGLKAYLVKFLELYVPISAGALLVMSVIIYLVTYNMTRPLKVMSRATKHYTDGDFAFRVNKRRIGRVREYNELADAMNIMAQSLETQERSRSEFVANVSHELKTPMTTIGGFVDGILDGTIDRSQEDYYLGIVSDEVKRLSRLVASMLNMSKMEAGELTINPQRVNLTEMLTNIMLSFEEKAFQKSVDVKGLEKLPNMSVEADRDMINQVFYNLIDNAVKFTEDGGTIIIKGSIEEDFVSVSIANTGKMLSSEDVEHVFDRFYKGDKSRGLDTKSTGLGLFIVRQIVELHGGEIKAENVDYKYTRFTVRLRPTLKF